MMNGNPSVESLKEWLRICDRLREFRSSCTVSDLSIRSPGETIKKEEWLTEKTRGCGNSIPAFF